MLLLLPSREDKARLRRKAMLPRLRRVPRSKLLRVLQLLLNKGPKARLLRGLLPLLLSRALKENHSKQREPRM